MSVLKSKKFTIDGLSGSYVLAMDELFRVQGVYKDGKIMDPTSDEWTTAVLSDESKVIRATYKGVAGEAMSLVEGDISTKFYNDELKKETNVELQQSLLENPTPTTFTAPLYGRSPTFASFTGRNYGRSKVSSAAMAYPLDIDPNQDHLQITKFKYDRRGDVNLSKPGDDDFTGQFDGTVILPMPKVSDSNGAEWGESDLNVMGVALANIYSGLANVPGKFDMNKLMKDAFTRGVGPFGNIDSQLAGEAVSNLPGTAQIIGSQLASAAVKVGGITVSPDALLARATGNIANPNAELLFQGPVLRDFGFSFLMIARSAEEGKMIRSIIKWFKQGLAPKYQDQALLGTPDVFKLKYSSTKLNQFRQMALRTMTVDYAPDGYWAAYDDSQPIALVMNLQFTELKPIYDKDQNESGDNVGY